MISVRRPGLSMSGLNENFSIGIYSDSVNLINVKLHGGTTYSGLPVYTTFSDLDHTSHSNVKQF